MKKMSKTTKYINRLIWDRESIQEFSPVEKSLYFWLMTNRLIKHSGVLEYNMKIMKSELNISKDEIELALKKMKDLDIAHEYTEGSEHLLYVKEYRFHQIHDSLNYQKGVITELKNYSRKFHKFLEEKGFPFDLFENGKVLADFDEKKSLIGSIPAPDGEILYIHNIFREIDPIENLKTPSKKEAMAISEIIRKYTFPVVKRVAFYCKDVFDGKLTAINLASIPKNAYYFALSFEKVYKLSGGVEMDRIEIKPNKYQEEVIKENEEEKPFDPIENFDYGDQ